ncbi:MAG TPA: SDR family NAD(P)-dependent oxidoreductase [Bacteroidia bacterium]|nr:SDR family NAD(P)-dependent oxidoreductase [Bacteroidia bacterium]
MNTSNNAILITGGTSGIGLAFAEEFLKRGNKVIICGRRQDRLNQLKEKHPAIIIKECDVQQKEQREELFKWIQVNHPDTNVLMNNAGIQLVTDLTKPVNLNNIYSEVETNLIAPIHFSSLFSGFLAAKKDAAIMNISSGLAFAPIAFMPVYCATKAAIHSLTISLRFQLRNTSVAVFEIIPPSVDTELGHERREDKTQTHGGIPVAEFLKEAMEGIENDTLETAVGQSKGLRAKREEMFSIMNK